MILEQKKRSERSGKKSLCELVGGPFYLVVIESGYRRNSEFRDTAVLDPVSPLSGAVFVRKSLGFVLVI